MTCAALSGFDKLTKAVQETSSKPTAPAPCFESEAHLLTAKLAAYHVEINVVRDRLTLNGRIHLDDTVAYCGGASYISIPVFRISA